MKEVPPNDRLQVRIKGALIHGQVVQIVAVREERAGYKVALIARVPEYKFGVCKSANLRNRTRLDVEIRM
jgi:hypothetical protein